MTTILNTFESKKPTRSEQPYGTRIEYPEMSGDASSLTLKGILQGFLKQGLEFTECHDEGATPPRLAVRAPASLGKSTAIIDILKNEEFKNLRVLYLVPTLDLADELAGKMNYAGIKARVFRGRSAPQPGQPKDGTKMCQKSDIAETLSAAGYSVARTLCETPKADVASVDGDNVDGDGAEPTKTSCPFAKTCPYFQQMKSREKGVIIGTYAYLTTPIETLKELTNIDLVIVDEGFAVEASTNCRRVVLTDLLRPRDLPADAHRYRKDLLKRQEDEHDLATGTRILTAALAKARERHQASIDDYMVHESPVPFIQENVENVDDYMVSKEAIPSNQLFIQDILRAFEDERPSKFYLPYFAVDPSNEDFFDAGDMVERAKQLAELQERAVGFFKGLSVIEYAGLERQTIHAGMDEALQRDLASKVRFRDALAFAAFWKRLAKDISLRAEGEMNGIKIKFDNVIGKGQDTRLADLAHLYGPKDIKYQQVPVLMIDASANDQVIHQFFDSFDFVNMKVTLPKSVKIAQVSDRTGSMSMYRESERRRTEVYAFMQKLASWTELSADKDRRPLFIGYKKLHEEAWLSEGLAKTTIEDGRAAVMAADDSFHAAHANGVRGIDRWKHTRAVVVAARMEPAPAAVETQTLAIFANVPHQIRTGVDQWNRMPQQLAAKDGQSVEVLVSEHPDPLINLTLNQIREEEMVQCLARGRPIHRPSDEPLTIFVLSNIPLTSYGYQPDSLFEWASVMPDAYDRWVMDPANAVIPDRPKDLHDVSGGYFTSYNALRKMLTTRVPTHDNLLSQFTLSIDSDGKSKCELSHNRSLYGSGNISISSSSAPAALVQYRREGCRLKHTATVKAAAQDTAADIEVKVLSAFPDAHSVEILSPLPSQAAETSTSDADTQVRTLELVYQSLQHAFVEDLVVNFQDYRSPKKRLPFGPDKDGKWSFKKAA